MSFSSSNFLGTYNSATDRAISFFNTANQIVGGINVCGISSITYKDTIVQIDFDAISASYQLEFISASEAKIAANMLKNALNALLPNCTTGVSLPPASTTQLTKTYSEFKSEASSNNLSPNTVYMVTDTSGDLNLGIAYTFYVIPSNSGQNIFPDCISTTGDILQIDISANEVIYLYNKVSGNRVYESFVAYSGSNTNLDIKNSNLTLNNVVGSRFSGVMGSFTNCSNIVVESCSGLNLANTTNSSFYGISGNYAPYTFSNIKVDPRISRAGKVGDALGPNSNSTLIAFINPQNITVPTLTQNITWNIQNPFANVNAAFYLYIPSAGIGPYTLTLRDSSTSNIITTISSEATGSVVEIGYDLSANEWKLIRQLTKNFTQNITISSDGQTVFPNALPYPVTNPSEVKLYVNGVHQKYGVDYTITGSTLTWTSSDFILETSDEMVVSK